MIKKIGVGRISKLFLTFSLCLFCITFLNSDWIKSGVGSSGKDILGIGKSGEVLTTILQLWGGAETTTTSTSYTAKAYRTLCLGSTIYNLTGADITIEFVVVASSCSVRLYNNTAGAEIVGSGIIEDTVYGTVPSTGNITTVIIPQDSFSSDSNIISIQIKAPPGITAKLMDAQLTIKHLKQ